MQGFFNCAMRIFPYAMAESTYGIDFTYLFDKGYRGLIFDIDNTLVEHNEPATDRARVLFAKLSDIGFKTSVVSNNKEPRVRLFADDVGCLYVYKAGKPKASGYVRAMELMGTDRACTLVIGDQLFTDIWGANNTGLKSVMVGKVAFHEEPHIYLKRIAEALILAVYMITHRKRSVGELL